MSPCTWHDPQQVQEQMSVSKFNKFIAKPLIVLMTAFVLLIAGALAPTPAKLSVFEDFLTTPSALAQQKTVKRRNIFEQIFGPRKKAKTSTKVRKKTRTVRKAKRSRKASTKRRNAAAATQIAKVEKKENAGKILVVGDFLAGALARGLSTAFESDPNLVVVNRFNGNSGIARADFYDWVTEIGPIIDEVQPVAIVMMAGANDRQTMRLAEKSYDKLSDEWIENYKKRVTQIADVVRGKGLPFLWVANPPMRSGVMTKDYLAFNSILKGQLSVSRSRYIDIWDKFTTDEGVYTARGPDVAGQTKTLRTKDGINFTKSGRRKLAFYVEQPLLALLERNNTLLSDFKPGTAYDLDGVNSQLEFEEKKSPALEKRTQVVSFANTSQGGSSVLVDGRLMNRQKAELSTNAGKKDSESKSQTLSPQQLLLKSGLSPTAPQYRADSFTITNSQ